MKSTPKNFRKPKDSRPPTWDAATVDAIFATFARADPAPKTELIAPNSFCLLVAIVLSAQATDVSVNKATAALFSKYQTPADILVLGVEGLTPYIKTIGLFNAKAKNVIALCAKLVNEHQGRVPETREALQQLPGVGRKTANVWLNCVLGLPTMAVDTHVFRVANRIGFTIAKNPLETEQQLEALIPARWMRHAHHWLILHGRYLCKARKPECYRCPIMEWCRYEAKILTP
jgi:endonuclease-3